MKEGFLSALLVESKRSQLCANPARRSGPREEFLSLSGTILLRIEDA